jgi:hypothetical protein
MVGLQLIPATQMLHQSSELDEIRDTEERALLAHYDFWIRGDDVGPLWGHRAKGLLIDLQQEAPPVAAIPLANAGKLLSAVGMERMSDPNKTRGSDRSSCTLD